ncbi:MAG: hypothetical protein R3B13_17060 [Polyangiaceae bacterium]
MSSAIPISAALHEISADYSYVQPMDIAIPGSLAMLVLGAVATRASELRASTWISGGAVAGAAAALGACVSVSVRIGRARGAPLDLIYGALFGAVLGAICLIPAAELRAARREQTHSAEDVQVVNTSAWLCSVVGASALFASTEAWLHLAATLVALAIASAAYSLASYTLRRRWLRRVLAGADTAWEMRSAAEVVGALPAVELLPWWCEEHVLVRVATAEGAAYRTADKRQGMARVIPSLRL